jgi:hypothetical protein
VSAAETFLMPWPALVACADLARLAEGLSSEALRVRPGGAASIAYHLRHIAGATDRLLTYARGEGLSDAQREWLKAESREEPEDARVLVASALTVLERAMEQLRATPRERLLDARAGAERACPAPCWACCSTPPSTRSDTRARSRRR